jgi:hypothetical protein
MMDYFSKWAEAIPLREAKSDNVINFLVRHIIYRFGVPHRFTPDVTSCVLETLIKVISN